MQRTAHLVECNHPAQAAVGIDRHQRADRRAARSGGVLRAHRDGGLDRAPQAADRHDAAQHAGAVDGHDRPERAQAVGLQQRAQRVPHEKQGVFKINEVMRAEGDQFRVRSDDPLEALLSNEPLRRLGALMAVDPDGRLKGIVTIEQISRALQQGIAH